MKKFFYKWVIEAEQLPVYMGYVHWDILNDKTLVVLMPFNILVRGLLFTYFKIQRFGDDTDLMEGRDLKIYNLGVREGEQRIKNKLKHFIPPS